MDTKEQSITRDEELKKVISESRPHDQWWKELVTLEDLRQACVQIPEVWTLLKWYFLFHYIFLLNIDIMKSWEDKITVW